MAEDRAGSLVERLRGSLLAATATDTDLTDGQLLEAFVACRDEVAVAALVRRHGPMVWGVCRRILRNHHHAEDAFQATFLVLVRKAASVRPRHLVGNWLHGVARRTALKARSALARRLSREKHMTELPEPEAVAETDLWRELGPLLDRELSRLSDKYRAPVVLCDLEGRSRKEVARELNIPEGTLSSRLTTARRLLARRLARHGLTVTAGTLAAVFTEKTPAAVPPSLASRTVKNMNLLAAGQATSGVVSAEVASLTQGVARAMLVSKIRSVVALTLIAAASIGVCVVLARGPGDDGKQPPPPAAAPKDDAKEARRDKPAPAPARDLIEPGQRLQIQASGTLPTEPIDGFYRVEPTGTVALGPTYGRVQVNGQTLEEAEQTIRKHLTRFLRDPRVSVTSYDPLADEPLRALEWRVRQLEDDVRKLQATVRQLRGEK
jgi:RNA polymerase sigma factor (sigma-70 family)